MMAPKRPDGYVVEEFTTTGAHCFEGGELVDHILDDNGTYTGIFWFEWFDGRPTRRYSRKTAPKWLLALYEEAINGRCDTNPLPDVT